MNHNDSSHPASHDNHHYGLKLGFSTFLMMGLSFIIAFAVLQCISLAIIKINVRYGGLSEIARKVDSFLLEKSAATSGDVLAHQYVSSADSTYTPTSNNYTTTEVEDNSDEKLLLEVTDAYVQFPVVEVINSGDRVGAIVRTRPGHWYFVPTKEAIKYPNAKRMGIVAGGKMGIPKVILF